MYTSVPEQIIHLYKKIFCHTSGLKFETYERLSPDNILLNIISFRIDYSSILKLFINLQKNTIYPNENAIGNIDKVLDEANLYKLASLLKIINAFLLLKNCFFSSSDSNIWP